MEVSHSIHYEGDGSYPEKNKRTLKTPAQVEALEKFYDEHKYPSDSLKLEFAQKIGLSEKQVSGWFCHRRSKDKKLSQNEVYANRKQNFPNSAMHDSASGLRQESCNSTKQGERYFDNKEVESKMECGRNSSTAIQEQRGRSSNIESYGVADDVSSGSSTASYERLLKQCVSNGITKPRYPYWNQDNMRMDEKGVKKRENVMDLRSSYLQADVKSSAVSLVKLKLGRQYREDGPPLSVDFDSIPPGAFDSPIRGSNCEPYYVGDTVQSKSSSIPVTVREPKMYEKYRSERKSIGSHPAGSCYNKRWQGYNTQNEFSRSHDIPKALDIKSNDCVLSRACIVKKDEGFTGEASDDYKNNNVRPFKYRPGRGYDSMSSHASHLIGLKPVANKPLPYPHPDHTYVPPMSQRELFGAKFPSRAPKRNELVNAEDNIQQRRPLKKKKIRKEYHENHNALSPEVLTTSNAKMARKVHGKELQKQDFALKNLENLLWKNPSIRYPIGGAPTCDEDTSPGSTSAVD